MYGAYCINSGHLLHDHWTSESEKESIIKLISDQANTLDAFIREILDYSRNSRRTLKLQWVNIKKIIDEVIDELTYMKDLTG